MTPDSKSTQVLEVGIMPFKLILVKVYVYNHSSATPSLKCLHVWTTYY